MKETPIVKEIQIALSRGNVRLWRNQVGEGWQGRIVSRSDWHPGCIILDSPRRLNFGLSVDSPDMVGLMSKVVTQAMVGTRIAVFAGIEVKTATGRASDGQKNWLHVVADLGGITGIARSVDEARRIILS